MGDCACDGPCESLKQTGRCGWEQEGEATRDAADHIRAADELLEAADQIHATYATDEDLPHADRCVEAAKAHALLAHVKHLTSSVPESQDATGESMSGCIATVDPLRSASGDVHTGDTADGPDRGTATALGLACEYGCDGPCEDLQHWKHRASYFLEVSNNQMVRAEQLEEELDSTRAEICDLTDELEGRR